MEQVLAIRTVACIDENHFAWKLWFRFLLDYREDDRFYGKNRSMKGNDFPARILIGRQHCARVSDPALRWTGGLPTYLHVLWRWGDLQSTVSARSGDLRQAPASAKRSANALRVS